MSHRQQHFSSVQCVLHHLECLRWYEQIDAYRILTYKELRDHITDRLVSSSYDDYQGDGERLGRLLFKLPSLAAFDTNIIEELFFVGLIGKARRAVVSIDPHAHCFTSRFGANP